MSDSFHFVKLDHVQVAMPSGEEQAAREFYAGILLMQEIEKPEKLRPRGGVWFVCGEQQIHLGVEAHFVPAQKAHPAFRVSGWQALRSKLLALGYTVKDDDEIEGISRFFTNDPFGNRLEFIEHLP
ncbi:glyoxalase [Paenibacillus thalictri]|uniref:Glyoxalase n=1 Tax=Paenibacillus thalictri TaxID=2527873 RepID=A0A4Q9DQG4_9BACL|nr:glyoxalase [Paenibacillus thalictri]TBL78658.1 glyoxalase [Paenibacillus thalictri]